MFKTLATFAGQASARYNNDDVYRQVLEKITTYIRLCFSLLADGHRLGDQVDSDQMQDASKRLFDSIATTNLQTLKDVCFAAKEYVASRSNLLHATVDPPFKSYLLSSAFDIPKMIRAGSTPSYATEPFLYAMTNEDMNAGFTMTAVHAEPGTLSSNFNGIRYVMDPDGPIAALRGKVFVRFACARAIRSSSILTPDRKYISENEVVGRVDMMIDAGYLKDLTLSTYATDHDWNTIGGSTFSGVFEFNVGAVSNAEYPYVFYIEAIKIVTCPAAVAFNPEEPSKPLIVCITKNQLTSWYSWFKGKIWSFLTWASAQVHRLTHVVDVASKIASYVKQFLYDTPYDVGAIVGIEMAGLVPICPMFSAIFAGTRVLVSALASLRDFVEAAGLTMEVTDALIDHYKMQASTNHEIYMTGLSQLQKFFFPIVAGGASHVGPNLFSLSTRSISEVGIHYYEGTEEMIKEPLTLSKRIKDMTDSNLSFVLLDGAPSYNASFSYHAGSKKALSTWTRDSDTLPVYETV
jgi:hypothetical protein